MPTIKPGPFLGFLVMAGLLSGCDPAPSTSLAPDHPMPDASKLSPGEVDKLIQHNKDAGQGRP